ncbi:unnamed protein product [Amoebophrya sp. A120]|nr:unnamed protein product [Amoebophrya sp. A120]|eukprot:GSA120T00016344001.1
MSRSARSTRVPPGGPSALQRQPQSPTAHGNKCRSCTLSAVPSRHVLSFLPRSILKSSGTIRTSTAKVLKLHDSTTPAQRSLMLFLLFRLLLLPASLYNFFVAAVRYQGWVNPLKYASLNEDGQMVFTVFNNLKDGAMGDDLVDAVQHHLALTNEGSVNIPMTTLRRNRQRFLVGTSDCNINSQSFTRAATNETLQLNVSSFLPHAYLLEESGFGLTKTFLNIGAKDGMVEDPCVDFAKSFAAKGIHFEKDEKECRIARKNFKKNLPAAQSVICAEVTPMNIVDLILENSEIANQQRHFDLIKLDIDSYDSTVLTALLENHFTAKFFFLEINPTIPPPYQYATLYHPKLWPAMLNASMEHWPVRGMSLSYAVNFMKKWDYELVLFEYHDAIFVHKRYKQIYGFTTPTDEFDCFHKAFVFSNGISMKQTRKWFYEVGVEQGLAEIFQQLIKHTLKNGKFIFPFTLQV